MQQVHDLDVEFRRIVTVTHINIAIMDSIWSRSSDSRHSRHLLVATRSQRVIHPESVVENNHDVDAPHPAPSAPSCTQASEPRKWAALGCRCLASSRNPAPAIATPSFCQCSVSASFLLAILLVQRLFEPSSPDRGHLLSDFPRKGSLQCTDLTGHLTRSSDCSADLSVARVTPYSAEYRLYVECDKVHCAEED